MVEQIGTVDAASVKRAFGEADDDGCQETIVENRCWYLWYDARIQDEKRWVLGCYLPGIARGNEVWYLPGQQDEAPWEEVARIVNSRTQNS